MTVDIGTVPVWDASKLTATGFGGIHTFINKENPATVAGRVTQVSLYNCTEADIVTIATFKLINESGGNYYFSTHDYQDVANIGNSTEVIGVEIHTGGSGYAENDILEVYQSAHVPKANLKVISVNGSGAITELEIVSGGTHHFDEENVEVTGGSGTGAKVNVTVRGAIAVDTNLEVDVGDYIGIYGESMRLVGPLYSGEGIWSKSYGNYIPCTNTAFSSYPTDVELMIGGEITADEEPEPEPEPEPTPSSTSGGVSTPVEIQGLVAVNENTDMVNIPCTLNVSDDADYFFGLRIPCEINVVRDIANACTATAQGIRATVTVDGEDVSAALVGQIEVHHNLDYISTFTFELCDPDYSPKINSHFDENKEVVITAYINGQTIKMFTGLIDEMKSSNTPKDGYRLRIMGSGYGKKLRKTETLISVQDKAANSYRGNIVKYLASKADITDVVAPVGDNVTIDHSFQDQEIIDMIRKENAIQGWYIRFDENGTLRLQTKELKSTADWEYGEGNFMELGLTNIYDNIVNKVIILGATFEEVEITQSGTDESGDAFTCTVHRDDEEYDTATHSYSKAFSAGESVTAWSDEDSNFKITTRYVGAITTELNIGDLPTAQTYSFDITKLNSDLTVTDVTYTVSGDGVINYQSNSRCQVARDIEWGGGLSYAQEKAFSISITIKTKEQTGGGSEELEEDNPEVTFTENVTYTTVKATVTDSNSIAKYGERKPPNEGTLNYPLAETEAQCQRIGENYIKDSHRFIEQPDFEVPFNPKIAIGQTVEMSDKKIGYDDDKYLVEEIVHYINIPKDGRITANTRIGCVYYT